MNLAGALVNLVGGLVKSCWAVVTLVWALVKSAGALVKPGRGFALKSFGPFAKLVGAFMNHLFFLLSVCSFFVESVWALVHIWRFEFNL